jgi:hypothetical protein
MGATTIVISVSLFKGDVISMRLRFFLREFASHQKNPGRLSSSTAINRHY